MAENGGDRTDKQLNKEIRISVRALVEFLLRSGDLSAGHGGFADREAMLAGGRIHRKLQKRRGALYRPEVSLRYVTEEENYTLVIEGRADGIFEEETADGPITVIEEIKGIYADPERLEGPVPVHLAQAKCYACIYAMQNGKENMRVQMTYVNLETEHERRFFEEYSYAELDAWFSDLLDDYRRWADFRVSWELKRNASMQGLEFPFAYRKGQHQLVIDIYRTILRSKQLFVQAPTGIGKTISAVFPSVRALGEGKAEKIFYLTAKTITRTVAEEAFSILREKGLCCKNITLTAKDKVCILEEPDCDPARCPRAKGHYDRVNDAVFEMVTTGQDYSRESILAQAEKWQVCPHEMQLDVAEFMDAVICDYNYVFDPQARLKRFFGEGTRKGDYLFLIDEAHNLVERGREMFSADIRKSEILEARRAIKAFQEKENESDAGGKRKRKKKKTDPSELTIFDFLEPAKVQPEKPAAQIEEELPAAAEKGGVASTLEKTSRTLSAINRLMLEYRKECTECEETAVPGPLVNLLLVLMGELEELLPELSDEETRKTLLNLYFRVRTFVSIYELVDENYIAYRQPDEEDDLMVCLYCVNPAANLQECLNRGRSAVFYSATMLPVQYYQRLLTTRMDNYAVYIDSPFDPSRRLITFGRDVSSRYTRRTHEEYVRMASYIRLITEQKKGNYLVFFPSYRLLNEVLNIYLSAFASDEEEYDTASDQISDIMEHEGCACIAQTPGMTEREREEFLGHFREDHPGTLIGFCVMGGIFSEGIDLTGERLIGAVIIGTGLPQIGNERELLRQYYDRKSMDGFRYAYLYPGMNKVLQAAGRVIRTTTDTGVIALLDDRFGTADYRALFPREWQDIQTCTLRTISAQVEDFWNKVDAESQKDGKEGEIQE